MISWHAEDESIVLFLVLYYTVTKSHHSPGGYCQLFKINKLSDIISQRQESSIHFGQLKAIDKEIFL